MYRESPPRTEPVSGMDGLYFMPSTDGLGTSRAFDAELWDRMAEAAGGPLAISAPTRDWLIFTRADKPQNISRMRTLSWRIARGEPYPVSGAVLVKVGRVWKALAGSTTPPPQ